MKLSLKERSALKSTKEGRLRKNIMEWTAHADKLQVRKDEFDDLSTAQQEDLLFRRLQVNRWIEELKGMEESAAAAETD